MSTRTDPGILLNRGRNRKSRPKTFRNEDAANVWAKANGLTSYKLVNLHAGAKIAKIRIEYTK